MLPFLYTGTLGEAKDPNLLCCDKKRQEHAPNSLLTCSQWTQSGLESAAVFKTKCPADFLCTSNIFINKEKKFGW